jgi:putative Ig domain-containing protein
MLAFSLAACGGGGGDTSSNATASDPDKPPSNSGPTPSDPNPTPDPPAPTVNTAPVIDGEPALTTKAGVLYSFVPTSQDAENDPLSYTITGTPGWATFDPVTGKLSGTPAESDVGQSDDIEITVSDGKATDSIGPFRIQVTSAAAPPPPATNRAPTITGTPATVVMATQSYIFVPIATDADNDTLTFAIANRPRWATFSTANGQLSGTPTSGQTGTYANVRITVSDGKTTATLPAFSIQVQGPPNVGPTLTGTAPTAATVGTAYSFKPTATDPNNDALIWAIQNKPSWAAFSNTTGQLSGTPTAAGTFSNIRISVSDGKAGAALGAFSIVVSAAANGAPVISGTPPTAAQVGAAYSFTPTASDPNRDGLTFSIAKKPVWATFSTTTGKLSGTPSSSQAARYDGIVISVTDGKDSASLPAFSITVAASTTNRVPTIGGTPRTSVNVNAAYTFTPTASDADSDTLTFSIANRPGWATFSTSTGRLSGTPSAADTGTTQNIVISVSDGKATASLAEFDLAVVATATGSASLNWAPPTENTDGSNLSTLAGYRILYCTTSTSLTQSVTINNAGVTSTVIENLTPGTWFFAIRAFTGDGSESANSNMGSKVVN